VWKYDLDTGSNVQMTKQCGFNAFESYDGKTIYYSRFFEAGIWNLPSTGGAGQLLPAAPN
jgi:hypothetical protein